MPHHLSCERYLPCIQSNKMCWKLIQQDIPLSVKLRLLLYFSPLEISFSALHLYSPTSLAELIVKLNKAGVKSVLFKADTFWLCLNSVYLTGGDPESEWQERLTFWFIPTSKVPWRGVSLGLERISGKKKLVCEFTCHCTKPPGYSQSMLTFRLYLILLK